MTLHLNLNARAGRAMAAAFAFSVRTTEYSMLSVFPGRP